MPKIRRGNYVFVAWVADHPPRHVHVFRGRRLVVKWNLEKWTAMKGLASTQIESLIRTLVDEGRL